MTRIAVVTLVHRRTAHLIQQHRFLAAGSRRPDHYVVVAMDDPTVADWRPGGGLVPDVLALPADPQALPLARARNVGVARALTAGADVVVVLDVDCVPGEHLLARYAEVVTDSPGSIWSGPVTYLSADQAVAGLTVPAELGRWERPHPARVGAENGPNGLAWELFWSLSFAVSSAAWRRIGGFCEAYVGYGGEDTDFARVARAAGVGLGWVDDAPAFHQYHPTVTPPVQHVASIVANTNLFHSRWGEFAMPGWLAEFERSGLAVRAEDGWRLASPSSHAEVHP